MANESPRRRRVLSLRWVVSGAAVLLTSITVLGIGGLSERNARQALTEALQSRLLLEARNLALTSTGALLSDYPELTLGPVLREMAEDQPELAFALVLDLEKKVRGHQDPRQIGQEFSFPPDLLRIDGVSGMTEGEVVLADGLMLYATAPVNHRGGETIGTAVVAVYRSHIDAAIWEARREQAVLVAILLGVGIVSAITFMTILLRPVNVLRAGLERIGEGDLETPVELKDRTELGLLAETVNEMAASIRRTRSDLVEKERLAREVELAREIQSSLLPSEGMKIGEFVIAGAHRAAAEVGGDYYDIFPLTDGRVGIAIADVSGKGLAGCLVTSMLSVLLRAFRETAASPRSLLVLLENHLSKSLRPGTFITMFYGILDPSTGVLAFASAGHSPLLVYRGATEKVEWYKTKGIPIGAVRGGMLAASLVDEKIRLESGDVLVQYTDGVNEAFDPRERNEFGFQRIETVVNDRARFGAHSVIEGMQRSVDEWTEGGPAFDDETLLVISRGGSESAPERAAAPDSASHALEELARARREGNGLRLPADLERLHGIRQWIGACPDLRELGAREQHLLETALYEVCSNIIEHGYGFEQSREIELWWNPARNETDSAAPSLVHRVREGRFVIVDEGTPFAPGERERLDFGDDAVRRRGRGIGLQLIRDAMHFVSYNPATSERNITLLRFDPAKVQAEEEIRHV